MTTMVEVDYKGEKLHVNLTTPSAKDGIEYIATVQFSYKNVPVLKNFSDQQFSYQSIVNFICTLIDKVGSEKYKEYSKKEDRVRNIRESKIVIDMKVYDYTLLNEVEEVYIMHIKMSDDTKLGGESFYKSSYEKEYKDRQITFNNLNKRILDYYKENNILPDKEFLDSDLTSEYLKLYGWFEQNFSEEYYNHIFPKNQ